MSKKKTSGQMTENVNIQGDTEILLMDDDDCELNFDEDTGNGNDNAEFEHEEDTGNDNGDAEFEHEEDDPFTDDDDAFLITVLNALENGDIPDYDCKNAHSAMKNVEPLSILNALKKYIPQEHLYNKLPMNKNFSGPKEVILSEYLIGE